jgi:hypothetical protein
VATVVTETLNWCSDTMIGIDKLYSIGAKGHIYIVHVQVCKYAGKPPNKWRNTIYKYIHLTERTKIRIMLTEPASQVTGAAPRSCLVDPVRDVAAAMGSVSWTRCRHGGGWCSPVHVTPCSGSLPTTYAAFGYGSTPYCVGAKPFVSIGYMAPRPNPPRPPLPRKAVRAAGRRLLKFAHGSIT